MASAGGVARRLDGGARPEADRVVALDVHRAAAPAAALADAAVGLYREALDGDLSLALDCDQAAVGVGDEFVGVHRVRAGGIAPDADREVREDVDPGDLVAARLRRVGVDLAVVRR